MTRQELNQLVGEVECHLYDSPDGVDWEDLCEAFDYVDEDDLKKARSILQEDGMINVIYEWAGKCILLHTHDEALRDAGFAEGTIEQPDPATVAAAKAQAELDGLPF